MVSNATTSDDLCTVNLNVRAVPLMISAVKDRFLVVPEVMANGLDDISNTTVPSVPKLAAVAPNWVAPSINLKLAKSEAAMLPTLVNLK